MSLVVSLDEVGGDARAVAGGKGAALARLQQAGIAVPRTLVLTSSAYRLFLERSGLGSMVRMELGRKPFEDMRWEELWDTALRIRGRFLRTGTPDRVREALTRALRETFPPGTLLAVRSSGVAEDAAGASFAGLHESVLGVRGPDEVEDAVLRVWSSLWSDRALLYRRELGLRVEHSAMAVLIQEAVSGSSSGVAFAVDPTDPDLAVIEAVYGSNHGLVDGSVEPDRWLLDRHTGAVLSHRAPEVRRRVSLAATTADGVEDVPPPLADRPPLGDADVSGIWSSTRTASELFGSPQDVEWTLVDGRPILLQSRPVTTTQNATDQRAWYLSLHRSLPNLRALRRSVEGELLPEMDRQAETMADTDPADLSDAELADEIERRRAVHDRWVDVYWRQLIPLAHGIRLFGQFYTDMIRPEDPYEFVDLLTSTPLLSLERNNLLQEMASRVAEEAELAGRLAGGERGDDAFEECLDRFLRRFGTVTIGEAQSLAERGRVLRLVLALARGGADAHRPIRGPGVRAERFLASVPEAQRELAHDLLDLARASYRLRDDDNIVLGRLAAEVLRAADEGRRRLGATPSGGEPAEADVVRALRNPNVVVEPAAPEPPSAADPDFLERPRQLIGQPAGSGVAVGPARVLVGPDDLFGFEPGEVLVCDAVDPSMTFVVPLACAVVERRGGMLVHGAIIAREYGLPCVTGVTGVTALVETGDRLTVDGFLGIVTVG